MKEGNNPLRREEIGKMMQRREDLEGVENQGGETLREGTKAAAVILI
jgi:hypothetical protein